MNKNNAKQIVANRMDIVWGVFITILAAAIMSQSVDEFAQGAPVEVWITDFTIGVLLLILFFGTVVISAAEEKESQKYEFGLADSYMLVMCVVWVVAGTSLITMGLASIGVIGFVLFGAIGVLGMLYKLYQSRDS